MPSKVKPHPKRFVAIDSNSLIHRAFHAFPAQLATSNGVQVNAVYGFTLMLMRVLEELKPKYLVCAFDLGKPTFRHEEFSGYKAQRKPPDKTLIAQIPMVKEVLKAFNVPILEVEGYEADDILGTLAELTDRGKWKSQGLEQVIVTGDKDLLQMVDMNTRVWLPRGSFKNTVMFDRDEVKKLLGFEPEFIPDFKALVGDSSDNIPGVKGVGKKTATELVKKYGHIEDIYKNLESLTERQKKLLSEGKEQAKMSKHLAVIVSNLDLDLDLEDCLLRDFDYSLVVKKFQEFEFRSLLKRIPESIRGDEGGVQMGMFGSGVEEANTNGVKASDPIKNVVLSITEPAMSEMSELGKQAKRAAFAFLADSAACMVGVDDGKNIKYFFGKDSGDGEVLKKTWDFLRGLDCEASAYGWEDYCQLLFSVIDLDRKEKKGIFDFSKEKILDIGLISYYLSTGQRDYSIRSLAFSEASVVLPDQDLGSEDYCASCLDAIWATQESLRKKLGEQLETIRLIRDPLGKPVGLECIRKYDTPLTVVLAEMSKVGILIDSHMLETKKKDLDSEISKAEKEIYDSVGHEFNISSTRQLGDVLFEELGLPVQKKTKTGYSTDVSVLEKLKDLHPCVKSVLKYREMVKLNSTYVEPLLKYSRESSDGRIHSTFKQTVTTTGRLSSQDPNLQNIPTRTDLGKEIKGMFIAPKGKTLISADYSQIELRILAHFSKDKLMMEDFESGKDFHSSTAARILGKDEKDVDIDDRRLAKTINFGVLYGLSPFGLSEQLGIGREDASTYINEYFEKYVGVKDFMEGIVSFVRKNGYVETLLGRRRYIPGVKSGNRIVREASEREAINLPMQGTAADIMRIAMVEINRWLFENEINASLLLQIHDELVFESSAGDAGKVVDAVKEIMCNVVDLSVPLEIEIGKGKSLVKAK
ncbi:DNA polymerase I [Candidatus Dojkabacteria bacterium]|nr:DNA polymerase I [Candidatus Dojkabacteria bacterium]